MIDVFIKRIPSILLVLLVMLPNIFFFIFPPKNIPEGSLTHTTTVFVLGVIENIGRVAVFAVPLFYVLKVNNLLDRITLSALILSLAIYYALYIRYFLSGRNCALLFSPLFFIPVPMAVFPVLCFAFSSILARSWPLALSTLILAAGHIPLSYLEFLRSRV